MKELIIQNIIIGMEHVLYPEQMVALKAVLTHEFINVDITMNEALNKEPSDNRSILSKFIVAKSIEGCSNRTLHYYQYELNKFDSKINKDLRIVSSDEIRLYLSQLESKGTVSLLSINNTRRILSSFYSWLENEEIIIKNPVKKVHKIKAPLIIKAPFSDDEVEALKSACINRIRDLAIVELFCSSGMRVGELVKLNRKDINFNERSCVVFGKGAKEREVYFDAATKKHLMLYLQKRKDKEDALFISKRRNARMAISGIESMIRIIGNISGVSKAHPHRFRHTMATKAIEKGMHIEYVQKLLGHVNIDTTLRYANVSQNSVKSAHRKYLG